MKTVTVYGNDDQVHNIQTGVVYGVTFEDGNGTCCGRCLIAELRQDSDAVFEYRKEKGHDCDYC